MIDMSPTLRPVTPYTVKLDDTTPAWSRGAIAAVPHECAVLAVEGIWELESPAVMTGGLTGGNSRVAPSPQAHCILLLRYNSCITHKSKNKYVPFRLVCTYVVNSMYGTLAMHTSTCIPPFPMYLILNVPLSNSDGCMAVSGK